MFYCTFRLFLCAFRKVSRAIQCAQCKSILEERCLSDLTEYHVISQTEEVHCVVTPDFLHSHIVDDIPNDPYCTPGFISAFRMLSPIREPVYTATARTVSGSLAEMERAIGDALFAGYVGYNGRAPGGPVRKEEISDTTDRNKSGGDARHTLVAYFEIIELASILFVDQETANLAVRIFRHTASNTSLRNRNVESLATAAFLAAVDRRCWEYQQWLKSSQKDVASAAPSAPPDVAPSEAKSATVDTRATGETGEAGATGETEARPMWPVAPRRVTVEEVATASNLEISEIQRNLKVVNESLRKQRPEHSSSITTHMPKFCKKLDLPDHTRRLAIAIVENATKLDLCKRRHPVSISAAAIYLACQLDGVRRTQAETCKAAKLTEVTLRKVYKELNRRRTALIPDWFGKDGEGGADKPQATTAQAGWNPDSVSGMGKRPGSSIDQLSINGKGGARKGGVVGGAVDEMDCASLVPPPLPPGFEMKERTAAAPISNEIKAALGSASDKPEDGTAMGGDDKALMAIMNMPAMKAFVNAFSMVPQMMMPPPPPPPPPLPPPPPPPPLPPSLEGPLPDPIEVEKSAKETAKTSVDAAGSCMAATAVNRDGDGAGAVPGAGAGTSNGGNANAIADFQSMVKSMAMKAFQEAMQEQMKAAANAPNGVLNGSVSGAGGDKDGGGDAGQHVEDGDKDQAKKDKDAS